MTHFDFRNLRNKEFLDAKTTLAHLETIVSVNSRRWFPELHTRSEHAQLMHFAIGMGGEVGEFLSWVKKLDLALLADKPVFKKEAAKGLADVLVYVLHLCNNLDIDLMQVFADKMQECEERWGPKPTTEDEDAGIASMLARKAEKGINITAMLEHVESKNAEVQREAEANMFTGTKTPQPLAPIPTLAKFFPVLADRHLVKQLYMPFDNTVVTLEAYSENLLTTTKELEHRCTLWLDQHEKIFKQSFRSPLAGDIVVTNRQWLVKYSQLLYEYLNKHYLDNFSAVIMGPFFNFKIENLYEADILSFLQLIEVVKYLVEKYPDMSALKLYKSQGYLGSTCLADWLQQSNNYPEILRILVKNA